MVARCGEALGTPVHAAGKREEEQVLAGANGGKLGFGEDAARRLREAWNEEAALLDFRIRIENQESLHPHDAVAYAFKGVAGGYDR